MDPPKKAHRAKTSGAKANKHKKNAEKNNPKVAILLFVGLFSQTILWWDVVWRSNPPTAIIVLNTLEL